MGEARFSSPKSMDRAESAVRSWTSGSRATWTLVESARKVVMRDAAPTQGLVAHGRVHPQTAETTGPPSEAATAPIWPRLELAASLRSPAASLWSKARRRSRPVRRHPRSRDGTESRSESGFSRWPSPLRAMPWDCPRAWPARHKRSSLRRGSPAACAKLCAGNRSLRTPGEDRSRASSRRSIPVTAGPASAGGPLLDSVHPASGLCGLPFLGNPIR